MTETTPRIGRPQLVDEAGGPTRDRIVAAALAAFIEKGYDAATLGEIAKAADVSPPAIYNHFASKSELFVEAARSGMREVESDSEIRDPKELLRVDASPAIRRFRRLLVELHTAALRHPELDAALAEWQQDHITRWVGSGTGSEASARVYYLLVQGLALMDSLHIDADDPEVAKYVQRLSEVLFDEG